MLSIAYLFVLSAFSMVVTGLGSSTDTYTWGGNYMRHGYQTNHNMDPVVVGSANFGQLFKAQLPGNFNNIGAEQIFSQPLVFTGNDGIQYLFVATSQNNIYKLNAKTGAIVASRNLHVPFLQADLEACTDISPTIGITGTGTIDPDTGIWYLSAKTYSEQFQGLKFGPSNPPGRANGRYYFHGIDTQSASLSDVFDPVPLEGRIFRNNPNRMFTGGIHHSRPGLVLAKDYVYTAFASHCVLYNFTGAVIGHNKRTGAIVEMFATEAGPEANSIRGGGIWMSGGGISYDGAGSLFFATGNGYASQLSGTPVPGRQPPSALEQAAVNAKINDDGTLSVIDFFMPWEKQQLDGADKDLGTTPLELLPTDVFTCSNVRRMGIVTGKSGKTYVLNLDNLGGYQMGANKLDNVVFMYQHENSVYAGAGVLPMGGGYIYINVIRYQTRVFKFSCDGSGNPQFTVVSYTPQANAYILGTGHGTTTSLNGQEGSALYWVSDVEGINLRIYNAIPPAAGGDLTLIKGLNAPGITKFSRPVFGDGIAYLGTTTGAIYAFGSPVNLPLNCSSPYDFGRVATKNSSLPLSITCVANIAVVVSGIGLTGNPNFNVSSLPSANLQLAKGGSFTIKAVFSPQSVGPLSSDVVVNTTNAVAGYSTSTPITLKGIGNSAAPLLAIGPNTVSFSTIAGQQSGGVNQTSIFSNIGDSILTVRNISYSLVGEKGPWVTPNGTAGKPKVGPFSFFSVPSNITANSQATVIINYEPSRAGNDACFLSVVSDGGTSILNIVASAGTYPFAQIEFEKYDGSGWTMLNNSSPFSFGDVLESQTRNLRLRVTNNGSASAVPLSITVSKPPYGVQGLIGAVNNIDLAEGTIIDVGQSATATLYCSVPKSQVNLPSYSGQAQWVMNTGDPTLGKQTINFTCNAATEQVGPKFVNGSARYGYVGCYRENNPGRQLAVQVYGDSNNTNERCINTCSQAGWSLAATQYQQECWCGNAVPLQRDADVDCNFQCTGNANQTCGGNGYFGDKSRMSLFADLTVFRNVSQPPLSIPASIGRYNYVGCYSEKGGKVMNSKTTVDPRSMSVGKCADLCTGYSMFALEFAQECYCGNTISTNFATLTMDSKCMTMACKGNNSEYCGAGNMAQVYALDGVKPSSLPTPSTTTTAVSTATSAPAIPSLSLTNYTHLGCYNETHDRRALNDQFQDTSTNTLNSCAAFCQGFHYFGVEYTSQCFCGNVLYRNSIKQETEVGCSMPCGGNSSQTCGGPDFLNVYYTNYTSLPESSSTTGLTTPAPTGGPTVVQSVSGYSHIGCYNEVGGRALNGNGVANSSMTVELCAAFCSAFQYFAVEYSSECYCGNSIAVGSTASTSGSCTMTCAANPNQYCGGPAWMNMYEKGSPTTSGVTSRSASSSSRPSSTTPAASGVPGWSSMGCWTDNVSGRALSTLFANSGMTLNMCADAAQKAGASYFGVEYGSECWYGTTLTGGNTAAPPADCSFPCPGNSVQICGAGNRLSLWQVSGISNSASGGAISSPSSSLVLTGSSTAPTPTATAVPNRIGNYTSLGCYTDNAGGVRALSSLFAADGMTLDTCAGQAQSNSAQYFGVEYGRECWYGNSIAGTNSLSPQSSCNMKCPGNQFQWCGAGNYLQMFNFSMMTTTTTLSARASSSSILSVTSVLSGTSPSVSSRASTSTGLSSSLLSLPTSTSPGTVSSTSTSAGASSGVSRSPSSLIPTSLTSTSTRGITSSGQPNPSAVTSSRSLSSSTSFSSVFTSRSLTAPSSISSLAIVLSSSRSITPAILSTSSRTITSSVRSSTSAAPSPLSTVDTYAHIGCYSEAAGRALNATSLKNSTGMSVSLCASYCSSYAHFGVEFGSECYCGPYLRPGSSLVPNQADCNMLCPGDRSTFCGAANRLNVYRSEDAGKVTRDPISPQIVGAYKFYNCVIDSPRLLSTKARTPSNTTVEDCMDLADEGSYKYAGVEYGNECWIGNELRANLVNVTAGACNMVCAGNVGQICGAGSRLSLYTRG